MPSANFRPIHEIGNTNLTKQPHALSQDYSTKLADAIVAELEQMILEGSLQPGQKLPPERELAIQFQVSRPSLREAIQRLEAEDSCIVVRAAALTYKTP